MKDKIAVAATRRRNDHAIRVMMLKAPEQVPQIVLDLRGLQLELACKLMHAPRLSSQQPDQVAAERAVEARRT